MRWHAGGAAIAVSAPDVPRDDDEISGSHPLDAGTAVDHLADTLVTDGERLFVTTRRTHEGGESVVLAIKLP